MLWLAFPQMKANLEVRLLPPVSVVLQKITPSSLSDFSTQHERYQLIERLLRATIASAKKRNEFSNRRSHRFG